MMMSSPYLMRSYCLPPSHRHGASLIAIGTLAQVVSALGDHTQYWNGVIGISHQGPLVGRFVQVLRHWRWEAVMIVSICF